MGQCLDETVDGLKTCIECRYNSQVNFSKLLLYNDVWVWMYILCEAIARLHVVVVLAGSRMICNVCI